jgi:hypothetical protein
MIDYRLSFFELFVVLTVMALFYIVVMTVHSGISLRSTLTFVVFACVLCFGSSMATAVFKFSKFLRQFPREAGSAR